MTAKHEPRPRPPFCLYCMDRYCTVERTSKGRWASRPFCSNRCMQLWCNAEIERTGLYPCSECQGWHRSGEGKQPEPMKVGCVNPPEGPTLFTYMTEQELDEASLDMNADLIAVSLTGAFVSLLADLPPLLRRPLLNCYLAFLKGIDRMPDDKLADKYAVAAALGIKPK